jgi:hypothetical protein
MKMEPRFVWFHNQWLCVQLVQQGKETIVIMIVHVDSINMMPSERPQRHTAAVCQYGSGKSMGICGLIFLHLWSTLMQVMWKHRLRIKQVTVHDSVIMHQLFFTFILVWGTLLKLSSKLTSLTLLLVLPLPNRIKIGPRLRYATGTFLVTNRSCSASCPTIVIQSLSTTSIENMPLSPFNKQCNGWFNISFSPFFLSHVLFIVIGCKIKISKRKHKLRM